MVKQYLDHSRAILTSNKSRFKKGSKGMGLISLFGYQNEYNLDEGFPLLTTRKMLTKAITHELIWFMKGESNIKYLVDNSVHLWDGNAFDHNIENLVRECIFPEGIKERYSQDWHSAKNEYIQKIKEDGEFAERWGSVGPLYGSQWRHWEYVDDQGEVKEIDQFRDLLEYLGKNPTGKRAIVTAWNPGEIPKMALPPCHVMFQVNGDEEEVNLKLEQRSCDMFLGVPINIASYAMLTQIIAQELGRKPGRFIHSFGDSHFYCGDGARSQWYGENLQELKKTIKEIEFFGDYQNVLNWINKSAPPEEEGTIGQDHVTAILEQFSRKPKELPRLNIARKKFDELTIDDFTLEEYNPHPAIRRSMAV